MSRPLLLALPLLLAACSSAAAAPPSPSPSPSLTLTPSPSPSPSPTPPPSPTLPPSPSPTLTPSPSPSPSPSPPPSPPDEPRWRSPNQLVASPDGRRLYVVDPTADAVAAFELPSGRHLGDVQVGRRPQQAALSPDGATLYVSCSFAARVDELDTASLRLRRSLPVGNEPDGLLVSRDGRRLFVTSYLDDTLDVLALPEGRRIARIPVGRGPRFLAQTPQGDHLVVSNGLGRSVTIVDAAKLHAIETRALGRASILRDVLVTPDGRFAIVAHVVSRDELVPTQLERGFIHANGFTILSLDRPDHFVTLLLDTMFDGAANPFGLAVTPDGGALYVSILGTDEIARVDLPRALALVAGADQAQALALSYDVGLLDRLGIARRLPAGGLGPRGITLAPDGRTLFVANYFSEAVARLSLPTLAPEAPLRLAAERPRTPRREGERLFDTASITFERWFSCVSCHEEDAGIDALNWDLPNDGTGNPKNVKSLRDAYDTPPAMWTAVRKDMDAAVRAGQRFQGFLPHMEIHPALRAFLDAPERPPNPHRAADPALLARGRALFTRARCDTCHPGPTFVDGRKHDLGLVRPTDPGPRFDTPSLRETYRTGPWLHDGRASTLESIFRRHDPAGLHGRAFELSDAELHVLLAYVRSL